MVRTRARLPVASEDAHVEIRLDYASWQALEQKLGKPLSAEVRTAIVEITNRYLKFAPFDGSPAVDDATELLRALSISAGKFHEALVERGPDDASVYVDSLLKKHFADATLGASGDAIDKFSGIVGSFIVACRFAAKEIEERSNDPFPDGTPWRQWIRNLTMLFSKEGFPIGARKDADKSDQTSPFVNFVFCLQNSLPEKYRRGGHSLAACAEQINNSRKLKKKTTVRGAKAHPKRSNKTRKT